MIDIKYIKLILFSMFLLFFSSSASAMSFYTPSDTDWYMNNIFNSLFNVESSPLVPVMKIFLGGVLSLGGSLFAYHIVVGTMNTAHDGQVLGKNWSTLWTPIRASLGIATIVPVKMGFCGIQLLILWFATQGIGFADHAWTAFTDSLKASSSQTVMPSMKVVMKKDFETIATTAACLNILQNSDVKLKLQSPAFFQFQKSNVSYGYSNKTAEDGSVYFAGDKNNTVPGASAFCGSITIPNISVTDSNEYSSSQSANQLANIAGIKNAISGVQQEQLKAFMAAAVRTGYRFSSGSGITVDEFNAEFNSAYNSFYNAVNDKVQSSIGDQTNASMITAMQQDGWSSAGAFYLKIAKMHAALFDAMTTRLQATGPDEKNISSYYGPGVLGSLNAVQKSIQLASSSDQYGLTKYTNENMDTSGTIIYKTIKTMMPETLNPTIFTTDSDPIVKLITIGGILVTCSITLIATVLAYSSGGAIPLIGDGFVGQVLALSPMTFSFFVPLFMFGLYATFVIPIRVFIIWSGSILGYTVLIFEALIAAPLWAMAHINPDPDGFVGKQGQGYTLILNLFLRPILMIFGFIVALNCTNAIVKYIDQYWSFLIYDQLQGIQGLIGMLVYACLYIVLLDKSINKCFEYIHSVSDYVLQWINTSAQNFGNYSGGIESNFSSSAAQVGNAGINMANAVGQGARDANAKFKQTRLNNIKFRQNSGSVESKDK